eukprot:15191919-Ditylum_brightwellii.AAC.1
MKLSKHVYVETVVLLISKHQEIGKEDAGGANQNVDDNMSPDEVLFCNISEEMLYNVMESLMPTLGE